MRALEPRSTGLSVNPADGVRSYFEVFGPEDSPRSVLLLPTWTLVDSRVWKMQVPYLTFCGYQVVTFDGRGNGRSDAPAEGYRATDYMADALAVLDTLDLDTVDVAGYSAGGRWGAYLATLHPERVRSLMLIAPAVFLGGIRRNAMADFSAPPPDREGWHKYNAVHWREDFRDFVSWFARRIFTEPHSTKGIEDIEAWARGTNGETLIRTVVEGGTPELAELWPLLRPPLAVVQGSDDEVIPMDHTLGLLEPHPTAELLAVEGGGHAPQLRDPVRVNRFLGDFFRRTPLEGRDARA